MGWFDVPGATDADQYYFAQQGAGSGSGYPGSSGAADDPLSALLASLKERFAEQDRIEQQKRADEAAARAAAEREASQSIQAANPNLLVLSHVFAPWTMFGNKKTGMLGVPGLGALSGPASSMVLAAAQAVHQDVASGRPLAQVDKDLSTAISFFAQVPSDESGRDQAEAAVASAQADRDSYASHQAGAQAATAGFDSVASVRITKEIDTGSGDVGYDAVSGTARDAAWIGNPLAAYAAGVEPGAVGQQVQSTVSDAYDWAKGKASDTSRTVRKAMCNTVPGATWDDVAGECRFPTGEELCDKLPWPLGWACKNPGKAAGVAAGSLAVLYLGPTILGRTKAWSRAIRA